MLSQMKWARTVLVAPVLLALLCGTGLAGKPPKLSDPVNLAASDITETSVTLTWQSGGGEIGFIVAYLEGSFPDPKCENVEAVDVGNATSYVVEGLNPGTTYGFRVCAYSSNKTSDGATLLAETLGDNPTYPDYVLIPLGTLGGQESIANALNDNGDIVGRSFNADEEERAMLWTEDLGMIDLNTRIAPESGWVLTEAWDINNAGQIVGEGLLDGEQRAFRLTPPTVLGGPYDIENLTPWEDCLHSVAYGINESGDATGRCFIEAQFNLAFLYTDADGITVPIPPLSPEMSINGYDVNSWCQITGFGNVPDRKITSREYAFLYTPGFGTENLGTFVVGTYNAQSGGKALNDDGAVVGWANTAKRGFTKRRAFIYTDATGMVDLGTLGGDQSQAWDINNSGNIVGHAVDPTGTYQPFLKYPGSAMISLNDLIVLGPEEFRRHDIAINEMNEVAASIITDAGNREAVILVPVSE